MESVTRSSNNNDGYEDTLQQLSEGSVRTHFEAFRDIDWDSPDFEVRLDDERWILDDEDVLGGHPWYKAQSTERQIEIGIRRARGITKVGLQFEKF